jgi:hypothetical protein
MRRCAAEILCDELGLTHGDLVVLAEAHVI